jgi:hypothetical protein
MLINIMQMSKCYVSVIALNQRVRFSIQTKFLCMPISSNIHIMHTFIYLAYLVNRFRWIKSLLDREEEEEEDYLFLD